MGWHVFIVVRSTDQDRVHPKKVQQEMRKETCYLSSGQSKLELEKQNHVSDSHYNSTQE